MLRDGDQLGTAVIRHGLRSGALQSSLIRREVFDRVRMRTDLRNGEDRFFLIRCFKAGVVIARSPRVTVHYRMHAGHSSCAGSDDPEKIVRVNAAIVRGYEDLRAECEFSPAEEAALKRALARVMFWHLGYNGYRRLGQRETTLDLYRRALALDPLRPAMWKTYLLALVRLGSGPPAVPNPIGGRR